MKKPYAPMLGLKFMREKKGIAQLKLAELVGVSQNTISMYETGLRFPSRNNLERLATALECEIKDIV